MKKIVIKVEPFGSVRPDGRVSHDTVWIDHDGQRRGQSYLANPALTVARLRHNIAEQYWFRKRRARWLLQS